MPSGSATAEAIDYSPGRWVALTRYLDDGQLPLDDDWVENQSRPIALGRSNCLFAGSLRAGQRAAAVMSLSTLRGSTDTTHMRICATCWSASLLSPTAPNCRAAAESVAFRHAESLAGPRSGLQAFARC